MLKTRGFLHITISVSDLARAEAFYHDLLGCEVVSRNPIMTFMKTGDDFFVLTKMENHVRPNPLGPAAEQTTLFHHAFLLEDADFDRALAHFEANGIDHFVSDFVHTSFPGRRHVYIFDPDGNSAELTTITAGDRARVPA
jgi:catechol 2,3-dioxygenase-like lactoylglutathione lyase family enzyme